MTEGSSTLLKDNPEYIGEVSLFRLYLLRATYMLLIVGLGLVIWPGIINHSSSWALKYGDTSALLAAVSVLAVVGIRYPLKMLPLLMFELTWKSIWLIAIALPLWQTNQINAETMESVKACLMGIIIFPIVIPWKYVIATYVKKPADRWK